MQALGALMGDQRGEEFGFGGLGLRGPGGGGGGTGEGTIGLGNPRARRGVVPHVDRPVTPVRLTGARPTS